MTILSDRMKRYEDVFRQYLPPNQFYIIRCDGRSFSKLTKQMERPFDKKFVESMQETAGTLFKEVQGAVFSFVQSDEINVVFTDTQSFESEQWFGGNIQKIVSISASICTGAFNQSIWEKRFREFTLAQFDSRVFCVPLATEAFNYLLNRQNDCTRNSIQMMARSVASHNECKGLKTDQLQELIYKKSGKNWNNLETHLKRGTCIYKDPEYPNGVTIDTEPPIFSEDWNWLEKIFTFSTTKDNK